MLMIEVLHFKKEYNGFTAVPDLSFSVRQGEIYGLLGPNGAGKTTTLECLEGLRQPSGGKLLVAGVDPSTDSRRLTSLIGVQLQTSGLPANITPVEALRFFGAYHHVQPDFSLLERLGLGSKADVQYQQLSTGLQRRLALAMALAHRPPVLFLDEPTAGLDVESRVELHKLMLEEKDRGTTILLATHDMAEAEELADRIAILLRGELVAEGPPMEITATGAGLTKISVRTDAGCLSGQEHSLPAISQAVEKEGYQIFFSTDIGPTVSAIINTIERAEDKLIDLRVERPSLEDRFLEITKNGGSS